MLLFSIPRLLVLPLFIACPLGASLSFFQNNGSIVGLVTQNFSKVVEKAKKPVLVLFYSPKCGHCHNIKNTWEQLADNMSSHLTVAAVNCSGDSLCSRFFISGVPSIKLFSLPNLSNDPDQKISVDAPLAYSGNRSLSDLSDFAKRHYPSLVTIIDKVSSIKNTKKQPPVTLESFLEDNANKIRVLIVKNGINTPTFPMKSLSVHFRKSVAFATVDSKIHGKSIEAALSSEFGQDFSTNDMNPNFLKILIVPKNKTLSQASHFLRDATFKTLKEHLRNLVAQSKEDSLNVDDEMLKSARNFADEL